ncbi:MAG TPA: protein kinase [Longimicrobiales bacterium]
MTATPSLCPGCFLEERTGTGPCRACGFDPEVVEYVTVLRPNALLQERYVVGRVLGEPGGFGVTYLAWDERLHRRIALKELMPRELVARDPDGSTLRPHSTSGQDLFSYTRESFLNEARMVARFKHPNLVKVLDYFEANNTAYFAMEFYEGRTLDGLMNQKGRPLMAGELLPLARPVLRAFSEVHAEGVLHRDVKPSNIYVRENGEPIVLDFGAARQTLENTRKLTSILTPGYAPLEQYDTDGNQGPWTDVYGCAATFYFALTGKQPTEALRRLQGTAMPSPRELVPTVDPAVDTAIMRGMAMEIADRTPSAEAFLSEMEGEAPAVVVDAGPRDDRTVVHPGVMAGGATGRSATLTAEAPASEPPVPAPTAAPATALVAGTEPGTALVARGEGVAAVMEPPHAGPLNREVGRRAGRKIALGAAALVLVSLPVAAVLMNERGDAGSEAPQGTSAAHPEGATAGDQAGAGTGTAPGGEAGTTVGEAETTDAAGDPSGDPSAAAAPPDGGTRTPAAVAASPAGAARGEAPPPTIDPATTTATIPESGATAQPGTGLAVLILGAGQDARSAETRILGGMLRVGRFEAVDAEGLQMMRADPGALQAALAGDFGALAEAGGSVGAEFVAVGDLQARAARTVGTFYGGSAELDVRLYRISTRRLLNTQTFQVGGAGTPQRMGNTEADARRQAIEAVADEAVAAVQRWMRLALR